MLTLSTSFSPRPVASSKTFSTRVLSFAGLALLCLFGLARADNENLLLGNPSGAQVYKEGGDLNNILIERLAYSLGYDTSAGGARWVSWHLEQKDKGRSGRSDDFRPDTDLPAASQIRPTDYQGSGYDRGHMCPSGDRTSNADINATTFFMSNMLPQTPDLNRQLWRKFEEYCRSQVKGGDNELYIISGGIGSKERIANGKVNAPAFCWKVAVVLPVGDDDLHRIDEKTRVVTILMPNKQGPEIATGKWNDYLTSVDAIEEKTGLDLLSNVPVEIQKVIESRVDSGRAAAQKDTDTPEKDAPVAAAPDAGK